MVAAGSVVLCGSVLARAAKESHLFELESILAR